MLQVLDLPRCPGNPVFASAVICLATTHKLLIVLSSIEVEENTMNNKQGEWGKLVGELWHALPKKWGSLGGTVPGSFLQLYLTQAELSIMAIPNQREIQDALKVATRFGVGVIKSIVTMVGFGTREVYKIAARTLSSPTTHSLHPTYLNRVSPLTRTSSAPGPTRSSWAASAFDVRAQ